MTPKQSRVLFYGVLIAVAMLVFPPTGHPITYGRIANPSYSAIFMVSGGDVIDMWRLVIQLGILGVACYLIGWYKKEPQ